MDQAITVWHKVHKRTKVHNFHNGTIINLTFFWFGNNTFDPIDSSLSNRSIHSGHRHDTIFVDIDSSACFFCDFTNGLTTRTDHITNLFLVNLEGLNTWSIRTDFCTWFSNGFSHLTQNVHTTFMSLLQSNLHDFFGDGCDLNIHLQSGHAVFCTSDLEVHIAQVIFITQDIG